jgi:hypothetical protein
MSSSRDHKHSGSQGKRPSEGEPSDKQSKAVRKEPKFTKAMDEAIIEFSKWVDKNGERIRTTGWNELDTKYPRLLEGFSQKDLYNRATQLMKKADKAESGAKSDGKRFQWDMEPELDRAVMAAGTARDERKGAKWKEIIEEFPVLKKAVKDRKVDEDQIRARYNQEVRRRSKK